MPEENIPYLFTPESVAVIGASNTEGKIGHEILENIIEYGYKGNIYPVNIKRKEVMGLKAYKSVLDVEKDIDLAIIAIPAKFVPKALKECGKKSVKAAVIISSGFSEVGKNKEEEELITIGKKYGISLLGPNVFGVIYTPIELNATFGPRNVVPGNIACITQSGSLGGALIGWTVLEHIGLSSIVSVGNKADVDDDDLLRYFLQDESTQGVVVYMEGLKQGRKFLETAEKVSKKKPIVIIKSGRSKRGAKAAASHTGSLAGSDRIFSAAFKQSGILRAGTMEKAFDWARMFSLPIPRGENTVILTNGGGVGVLATDNCETEEITLLDDHEYLEKTFRPYMPSFGSTKNPIDLTGQITVEEYLDAFKTAMESDRISSLIVLNCETAAFDTVKFSKKVVNYLRGLPEEKKKPIVFNFVGGTESKSAMDILNKNKVPAYPQPERAVNSLGALYQWWRYTKEGEKETERTGLDKKKIHSVIARAREEERTQLLENEAKDILRASGLEVPPYRLSTTTEEAVEAAENIGYPVVLKIVSKDIIHKSDINGVKIGIKNEKELKEAYGEIMDTVKMKRPEADISGIIVNKMVERGVETIVGCSEDPQFGPVVMFGLGGIYVEVLKDVAFRVAPIDREEALEMIHDIKTHELLFGVRGQEKKDIDAIAKIISRVSQLAYDFPEIIEMDINPLIALERGAKIADARMTIKSKPYETAKYMWQHA
ncbi:MAG: acetate--CoA ligase family protein [Euryarchaeota archaeon]|nr:acetate--CoA ligase family protein [Euryarchaeota archaeon]